MTQSFVYTCCIAVCCCLMAAAIPTGFTVVYDARKKAVNIQWQQKTPGIKSFVVQRSSNNTDWSDIAFQGSVNFSPNKVYQYMDYKATAGQNYYRLKSVTDRGQTEYSPSVMVITGEPEANWVMYPVPVKDVLTLQYKGTQKLRGVVNVFISNLTGYVITRVRSASLNTVIRIPVDNLGKGIYDIRIIIEDEVVWNQRFVK